MKRVISMVAGTLFLVAACTPGTTTRQTAVDGEGAAAVPMMANQERDLGQALATVEAATVKRQGDLLTITLQSDLLFSRHSAAIDPDLQPVLDRLVRILDAYPQTLIRVEGHTDNAGTDAASMELSYRQALAVKNAFIEGGIAAGRLQEMAFGKAQPIAGNDSEIGRQQNRRVEVKITPFSGSLPGAR